MFRSIIAAAVVLAVAVGLAFWAYARGDDSAETEVAGGGDMPPHYEEPVPLVPGDYVDASFPFQEVAERGLAVWEAEKAKPVFEGTINGFELYSLEDGPQGQPGERRGCVRSSFPLSKDLTFDYLPPGTSATSPQFAGICEDGSLAFVMQSFVTKHGSFDIIYQSGEKALGHGAPAERVSSAEIGGRPAVVIRPLVEEGFGRSWVAVGIGKGFVFVDALDLPLSETMKIAEGVRCADC